MFCKWCGATISESSARCKRCGRNVPALSDCGGFYDLIPNAPKDVLAASDMKIQPPSGVSAEQNKVPTKRSEGSGTPKKAGTRKVHKILPGIIFCYSMLVLVFLAILIGNIQGFTNELEQLREENDVISSHIHEIQETLASRDETVLPKPSDPAMTNETILAEQNVDLNLEVANGKSSMTVASDAHLGNCETPVSVEVRFDTPFNSLVNAQFKIGEHERGVDVTVNHDIKPSGSVQIGYLSAEANVDEALFGNQNDEPTYQWKYRLVGDKKWSNLPETFRQTKTENGTKLSYKISDIEAQAENGDFEFQLVFCRRNTNGGTLTLTISGIRIPH